MEQLERRLREAEREVAKLRAERDRLMVDVGQTAEREQRRLAEILHDGAVQELYVARQELAELREGNPASLEPLGQALDRALAQVRRQVTTLHPLVLAESDLSGAIEAIARQMERLGRFSCSVHVEPEKIESHQELLLSAVRELLLNVARHAVASRAGVDLGRKGSRLMLEVTDDGCGMEIEQVSTALAEGHIGLASLIKRVEQAGGTMEIGRRRAGGTRVRVTLPIPG